MARYRKKQFCFYRAAGLVLRCWQPILPAKKFPGPQKRMMRSYALTLSAISLPGFTHGYCHGSYIWMNCKRIHLYCMDKLDH